MSQPPMGQNDMMRAMASTKSYVGSAIITFIGYFFFWIPGIIFNIMYINDAKKMEAIAGHKLPGTGCLWILLILNVGWVLLICSLTAGGVGIAGMGAR